MHKGVGPEGKFYRFKVWSFAEIAVNFRRTKAERREARGRFGRTFLQKGLQLALTGQLTFQTLVTGIGQADQTTEDKENLKKKGWKVLEGC